MAQRPDARSRLLPSVCDCRLRLALTSEQGGPAGLALPRATLFTPTGQEEVAP